MVVESRGGEGTGQGVLGKPVPTPHPIDLIFLTSTQNLNLVTQTSRVMKITTLEISVN